jgi:hypothetical protein
MPALSPAERGAADLLLRDLDRIFGARLTDFGVYAAHESDDRLHALAVVDAVRFEDLAACVPLADSWQRRRIAVPLLLSRTELERTLDVFPLEYAGIQATLTMVRGLNPFAALAIQPADVRRALEAQAKSHLIHLREGFLESQGEAYAIGALLAASVAPFRTLLTGVLRLAEPGRITGAIGDGVLATFAEEHVGIPAALIRDVFATAADGHATIADPSAVLSRYLDGCERLWSFVDAWKA